jgi:hypothetical protein
MAAEMIELDQIEVASPCHASWAAMQGDQRVRFCRDCKLNVYNLSAMTRVEAQQLVQQREGRLCVRFYRRPDGTVLTRDCPIGFRAVRDRFFRTVAAIVGLTVTLLSGTLFAGALNRRAASGLLRPAQAFANWIEPARGMPPVMGTVPVMGGCAPPASPVPATPNPPISGPITQQQPRETPQ